MRINITVPEDVLREIGAFAQKPGVNRSNFLVRAAKREMREERADAV